MHFKPELTDDFLFESLFLTINGHKVHYIDVGIGENILFIHGNPTSSYLWRNIIPYLSNNARCIALDLIGFGKSDRPDIDYKFITHADYLEKFIVALNLKNISLVLHDWGCALGFHYGLNHLENIRSIVFMEGGNFLKPICTMQEFNPEKSQALFTVLRDIKRGPEFVKTGFPFLGDMPEKILGRKLSIQAWNHYKAPFNDSDSRKPMWVFPTQFPIGGEPKEMFNIVNHYSEILQECDLPKIMFYATLGSNTTASTVQWVQQHLKNIRTVNIGPGTHYLPEDNPVLIGEELAIWYKKL